MFTLRSLDWAAVTTRDVALARRISAAVNGTGPLMTGPEIGTGAPRSVRLLEIAIDALDIAAIRPFWNDSYPRPVPPRSRFSPTWRGTRSV